MRDRLPPPVFCLHMTSQEAYDWSIFLRGVSYSPCNWVSWRRRVRADAVYEQAKATLKSSVYGEARGRYDALGMRKFWRHKCVTTHSAP